MDVANLDDLRIVLDPIGQAGIAVALMLVMLSVALSLRVSDFAFIARKPLLFVGGIATQLVGLPLATYVLIITLEPPASIALGMIVVACCPGGASSNLLTYLARGDVAYSVSLTATSSILAAILTPASILFWSHAYAPTASLLQSLSVSPATFLVQTSILLALPLLVGMIVGAHAPDVASRIRKTAAIAGSLALGGVIVYGTIQFYPVLINALPLLGTIAVLHNAIAFMLGALAATLLRASSTVRRALTFEIGIQNSGLALVILLGQLRGLGGAAAIAAVWGVWHLIAGGLVVVFFRRSDRAGT